MLFSFVLSKNQAEESTLTKEYSLASKSPEWKTVFTDNSTSAPILFEDGFLIVDNISGISFLSKNGNFIWKKNLKIKENSTLYPTDLGVFYAITNDETIHIINYSGYTVNTIKIPFSIKNPILTGNDRRIFVFGENQISCYGFNAIFKWNIKTSKISKCPAQLLPDGSILVFFEDVQNFFAIRYSQYGKELEHIDLNSKPLQSIRIENQLFVLFLDNKISTFTLKNEKLAEKNAYKLWVKDYSVSSLPFMFDSSTKLLQDLSSANNLILCNKQLLLSFNLDTLEIEKKISLQFQDLLNDYFTTDGASFIYNNKNWETVFYKISSAAPEFVRNKSKKFQIQTDEKLFYSPYSLKEISNLFNEGSYGLKEKECVEELQLILNEYYSTLSSKVGNGRDDIPDYTNDFQYLASIFSATSKTGTDTFIPIITKIISVEKNESILTLLVDCAGNIGFDNYGAILSEIEIKISQLEEPLTAHAEFLNHTCQALSKMNLCMGNNYNVGPIIASLLNPLYGKNVNNFARKTLSNLYQRKR